MITSPTGGRPSNRLGRWCPRRRPTSATATGPASPSCFRMSRWHSPAASSRACRSPGASQGRRRPRRLSSGLAARSGRNGGRMLAGGDARPARVSCPTSRRHQEAEAAGRRTCGSTECPIGWHAARRGRISDSAGRSRCDARRCSNATPTFHGQWRGRGRFIVRTGPATQQDRWEEDARLLTVYARPSTVAALLVAAELAGQRGAPDTTPIPPETADGWNDGIEAGPTRRQRALAEAVGSMATTSASAALTGRRRRPPKAYVPIKNRPDGRTPCARSKLSVPMRWRWCASASVAARRSAHPQHRAGRSTPAQGRTAAGTRWQRYNEDGYGEHEDGAAVRWSGIGRAWPLLTGERAHYEIAAGRA